MSAQEDLSIPDFKMRDDRARPAVRRVPVEPKWDRIFVRPIFERLSTVIDVQSERRERIVSGTVLKVGPRVRSDIKPGDVVYFSQIQRYEAVSDELWIIRDNNLAFVKE